MAELSATVAEARANFSKIATRVNNTGETVTVFRNSKPWVVIAPVGKGYGGIEPAIDWSSDSIIQLDKQSGHAILPAEWDYESDEGLYDDLVK